MSMLGNKSAELNERRYLKDGQVEVSERTFNLIFGGCLIWAFALNTLLVWLFQMPMVRLMYSAQNPVLPLLLFIVAYFACVIAGNKLMHSDNTLVSFAGFNLIALPIGLLLSVAIAGYSPLLVLKAVAITGVATGVMTLMSALFPQFFSKLGPTLAISLISCIIAELVAMLIFRGVGLNVFDWIVVALMCLYIGYDWTKLQMCARTPVNAICVASMLYLDIVNLFLRILRILSRSRSRD